MQPYYTIMRLPGETEPEFIQMLPFTPRRRDNLAAWLVARSDGEHYGKLRVFQFPKQKLIFGPRQVVARISQDQTISPQITLWNQQGSQVIWGTLMVIPIEESLIYVRPLYLRASGRPHPRADARHRRLPEPDRDGSRRSRPALARLFGGGAGAAPPDDGSSVAPRRPPARRPALRRRPPRRRPATIRSTALAAEARGHYDRAIEAQRAGDWAKYGEEIAPARRGAGADARDSSQLQAPTPRVGSGSRAWDLRVAGSSEPRPQHFGDAPRLRDAAARRVRALGVEDLAERADAGVVRGAPRSRRGSGARRPCRPGWTFSHASTNGPTSQPQTVPWW